MWKTTAHAKVLRFQKLTRITNKRTTKLSIHRQRKFDPCRRWTNFVAGLLVVKFDRFWKIFLKCQLLTLAIFLLVDQTFGAELRSTDTKMCKFESINEHYKN